MITIFTKIVSPLFTQKPLLRSAVNPLALCFLPKCTVIVIIAQSGLCWNGLSVAASENPAPIGAFDSALADDSGSVYSKYMQETTLENCLEAEIPSFLYQVSGIDVAAGLDYCGDAEDYLIALIAFQERVVENAALIEEYWRKQDIRNVTVKIHGVKSTSRAIGALSLGELAAKLEKAGNEEAPAISGEEIDRFLREYRALGQALSPVQEASRQDAGLPPLSLDELREILGCLKNHVENADYDNIETIGEQLSGSAIPPKAADYVQKLCHAISDLDYDVLNALLQDAPGFGGTP